MSGKRFRFKVTHSCDACGADVSDPDEVLCAKCKARVRGKKRLSATVLRDIARGNARLAYDDRALEDPWESYKDNVKDTVLERGGGGDDVEDALGYYYEEQDRLVGKKRNPAGAFKTIYLAVLKGHRKPKAVGAEAAGWYRQNAREFYEIAGAGITAERARQMIKAGQVQPTWRNGAQVDASGRATGRKTLSTMLHEADAWLDASGQFNFAVLVFTDEAGHDAVYIPAERARGERPLYVYTWHKTTTGITYDPKAMTIGDLQRYVGRRVVLGLLREAWTSDKKQFQILGSGRRWVVEKELTIQSLTRQDVSGL